MLLLLQGQHRLRPLQHLSQAAQGITMAGLQRRQSLLQGRLCWGRHLQQQKTCCLLGRTVSVSHAIPCQACMA